MGNTKPNQKVLDAAERIRRYDKLIQKQTGVAVKPLRFDGYFNLLNKYGTQKDTTENYQYATEPPVADEMLSSIYEGNGLFARIIDAPAEEAMKAGFELDGIKDTNLIEFYEAALDDLDWEETCITAIKWARLFGGSIAVMLVNDGNGIDEPLDWKNIHSIDGIRVYDRSVVQPDYNSMFSYNPEDPFRARGNMIGVPEFYNINSKYGSFTVHESRCLVFKNGVLPENCSNSIYEMWGMPEYIRIKRAMRDCELAHGNGPKMLERAIQAVYKVRNLSELLQTDAGEDIVVKRLQTIDLARGLLNSIAIDSEGEEYDFKTFTFTGVSEIIDTTCNQLSALTSIPQTILFGRSPAGMNSTGESDMENWYSFVGRIQKRMIGRNLRYLLSVIFQAGVMTGEIDEIPPISPKFRPLWSLSELEEAQLEQTKAATQQTKAATAQIYVGMQALDPSEVRKGLSDKGELDIETLLDDYTDEELFPAEEQVPDETAMPTEASGEVAEQGDFSEYAETNTAPAEDPAASQTTENTPVSGEEDNIEESENVDEEADSTAYSVGVIVISGGKVLCGDRQSSYGYGLICGPGGHIESGENSVQAALRETEEEFGIIPNELIPLGVGSYEPDTGLTPILYLCTDYAEGYGSVDHEIINTRFMSLEEIYKQFSSLFKPFKDGVEYMLSLLENKSAFDGGASSGNHGHEGIPGKIGGSAPSAKVFNDKISESYKTGKWTDVDAAVRKCLNDSPVGAKVTVNGTTYTKVGKSEYEYEYKPGHTTTTNINGIANSVDTFNSENAPRFEEIKSEDIAETMVKEGDLDPKKTDVEIRSLQPETYKGSHVVDVSKQQFQSLREELQNNSKKPVTNDEIKDYLDAIDTYRGTDFIGVIAASSDFEQGYEGYASKMSPEAKEKAKAQADTLERFINNANKYDGKVQRALGFDLGGEFDDGSTTKQFEELIGKCKPGQEIDMGHISSWTTNQDTIAQVLSARSEVDESAERSVQVVITCPKSKNGVDVGRFSKDFTQGEVIFSKWQKFMVKSVSQNEVGDVEWPVTRYDIEVEEVLKSQSDSIDGVPLDDSREIKNCEKPLDKCSECVIVRVEDEQRVDADKGDLQFITVNGAHVPLVDGKAVGGPLKGEDFSESKPIGASKKKASSRKSKGAKKSSESTPKAESKCGQGNKEKEKSSPAAKQTASSSSNPSPHRENKRTTGFINTAELDDHFSRHGKALGCSSKEEYQEKGISLLTKACTNGIAGYARADGKIVRFNTKTGEYVSGYPGQNLCTYMIPKDKNGVDLQRALDYYNKHRLADEAKFGTLKKNK